MTCFDLFLLDAPNGVIALGRRGADTAIVTLPTDAALIKLSDFGKHLGKAVAGKALRPPAVELDNFGDALFAYLFRGDLGDLYARLPQGPVSLQILSNNPSIREVPWEYLTTPDRRPAPHRDRSVIRVHPTRGIYAPPEQKPLNNVRVLFVSADPVDQAHVDFSKVEPVLRNKLAPQMPEGASITIVEGANRADLLRTINKHNFDVFHFFGHGTLRKNVGHLVLEDLTTGNSDYLSADDLATALSGKNIRLAILSACLSGAGKHDDDFGVIATALISAGIPAVLANQYPIPIPSIAPFVGSVYETLSNCGNIDRAVADGRIILKAGLDKATGDAAVLEWGIPTLHRLADAQQIFGPSP